MAACQLARMGKSVLLVDKAVFPRWKVCGCCLNAAALAILRDTGLGGLAAQSGADDDDVPTTVVGFLQS